MRRTYNKNVDDSKIDLSDIPEVTDFSNFRPAFPRIREIRKHNIRVSFRRGEIGYLEDLMKQNIEVDFIKSLLEDRSSEAMIANERKIEEFIKSKTEKQNKI